MTNLIIDLIQDLLNAKSWQQAAIALGAIGLILYYTASGSGYDGKLDLKQLERIERVQKLIGATAIVFHVYANGELTAASSTNPEVVAQDTSERWQRDKFGELKLGNCIRSLGLANYRGEPIVAIVCPIIRDGLLVGTISGAYETPPLKNSDGTDDPISGELFVIGTAID